MKELVLQAVQFFEILVDFEVAVFAVSDDRMTDGCKVDAELMRSSCEKFGFDQRESAGIGLDAVETGKSRLCTFLNRSDLDHLLIAVLDERIIDLSSFGGGSSD